MGLDRCECVFAQTQAHAVHKPACRGQSTSHSPIVMTVSGSGWEKAKQKAKYLGFVRNNIG